MGHSQARQSASSQLPVLQFHEALSGILQRKGCTSLESKQGSPTLSQRPIPVPLCHALWEAQSWVGSTPCPQAALRLAQTHCGK